MHDSQKEAFSSFATSCRSTSFLQHAVETLLMNLLRDLHNVVLMKNRKTLLAGLAWFPRHALTNYVLTVPNYGGMRSDEPKASRPNNINYNISRDETTPAFSPYCLPRRTEDSPVSALTGSDGDNAQVFDAIDVSAVF